MDQAVESVLDNLRLIREYWDLMNVSEEKWENMKYNLGVVKAFVKDSSTKSSYSKTYQELALHIRNCLCDMDDIIDDCRSQVVTYDLNLKYNPYPTFLLIFLKPRINLLPVAQILDSVTDEIQTYKNVIGDFSTTQLVQLQRRRSLQKPPLIGERNLVIGLEEETKKVIGHLTEETKELDVVPIVGKPGIGKTTLAWKTFISDEVMNEFPTRIWINVSNEYSEKEVFLAILKHFTEHTRDIDQRELQKLVASYLQREKFLIVMDDVCSPYDWNRLQIALPQSNKKGKVLITSRNENVVRHAIRSRLPLKVGFLTRDASWFLLRSEVFGDHECPRELEYIGQVIADQCDGLPLAILGIASILLEEDLSSSNMKERRIAWTKVSSRIPQYLSNIFYRSLPYQTQLCFLYFGMFPEGYDIPVWKLISMWIAEGFIQYRVGMSLEETAETYLEDLISRNLVITGRIKSSGKIKDCRISPMLHEFCRFEAGKQRENFLQPIDSSDGDFDPPISDLSRCRRLSVSSNIVLEFLSSKPFGPRVRSFVCSSHDENDFPTQYSSAIPAGFKRLRVLDVKHITFTKIPNDMYQLIHLRFLVLSINFKILPAEFSKLCNIQTLILHTTSPTLEIRANIWQFTQLKHLKTNAPATFVTTDIHLIGHSQSLQTLAMVSPESCTGEFFIRASNLKKLGIRGKLQSLPPNYTFPPRLRSLTLAQTYLDWSQMDTLGRLHMLEVLKLKDCAFMGESWVTQFGGFVALETLYIEHTDLVTWVTSATHFPRLKRLILKRCEKLQAVPIQLASIQSLQYLDLYGAQLAVASAIMIRDEINNRQGPRSWDNRKFELRCYPPIE